MARYEKSREIGAKDAIFYARPITVTRGTEVEASWNVMAHAQKPNFVFRRNGRVHLHGRGCQFSRLLAAELCASAVVMLDTPCSEVVWRVLATHPIHQFPLHFPSRMSPCAIIFQPESNTVLSLNVCTRWCSGQHHAPFPLPREITLIPIEFGVFWNHSHYERSGNQ